MEIDYNKLKDMGIRAEDRKGDKQKMHCPECHSQRKNKADKSLSVDWVKCIAHCHHCDQSFFFGKTEKIGHAPAPVTAESTSREPRLPGRLTGEEQPDANMLEWFAGRGIPAEILQHEGITKVCRKMPQTGQVERCIVFPYLLDGQLVNRKYRDGRKNFMLEAGARLVPWRIDHIRHTEECIITEGEMDALSFVVAGRDDVVSVTNGAQANLAFLDDFVETHLENKKRVFIAVDTDAKGLLMRAELVRRLGEDLCRIVTYGEDCKDANELL
ncbi:MAG: toprim domain-containing protein, partial [Bacteroidaceae bacterium]|nr:toprim domain-containing protein [Bacteroidaceae bacterium]